MDVYDAVVSRQTIRKFAPTPIPRDVLDRVFAAATRAPPSGGNLQPWNIFVLTGASLVRLKARIAERIAAGDEPEFALYPGDLKPPYRERQWTTAERGYAAMGISREDIQACARAVRTNWGGFGAPAALFCYVDQSMGLPQWVELGSHLQTVMLLLRHEGLDSCTQMAWTVYHRTVAERLLRRLKTWCSVVACHSDSGMRRSNTSGAIAPLSETVTFLD